MVDKTQTHFGVLFLVLGIATFLRFYNLEFMEFKGDEGFNLLKALQFVQQGVIPLTSAVSSTGVHEPPIFMYILALLLLFSTNPLFITGFVALLNSLGVGLCYLIVRRLFDRNAALFAAAFYAVNPWQILFSRKIWTQNLLAPFILLFLYLAFTGIVDKRNKRIVAACFILGLTLQLHMSAMYFVLVALMILIVDWKKISKPHLVAGIGFFLCPFIPYLIFMVQDGFGGFATAAAVTTGGEGGFRLESLKIPFTLISTQGLEYSLGQSYLAFEETVLRITLLDYLAMGALVAGLVYMLASRRRFSLLIGLWPILGLVYFSVINVSIYVHYFHSLLPVFFILLGVFAGRITSAKSGIWRGIAYTLTGALLMYQLTFSFQFLRFIGDTECIHGDYGAPYARRLESLNQTVQRYPTTVENLRRIHRDSCFCVKCDPLATIYIVKHLDEDFGYWPKLKH